MSFDPRRIAEPDFFAENRTPAHSDHRWYATTTEAEVSVSSFEQNLNGLWKFHYAKNPALTIQGFEAPDHDSSAWDDIPVPSHIQLQGYGRPQYVNVQYPWDGSEAIAPGQVPQRFNPVGSYVRNFTLDHPLSDGERLSVVFNGAESAIVVWLNGTYIGYGCDSFTPSEFDITDAMVSGENKLCAQVYQWSAASWIEDQDFFRFSGLFRDVVLRRRPRVHIEDLEVRATLSDDLSEATISVRANLIGQGTVVAAIDGVGVLGDSGEGLLSIRVPAPRLWSAEDPFLYTLGLQVFDLQGELTEFVPQRIGVRRFGIEDGLLKINGQRIVFNGVNRHEFGLQGRVMSREETEADLKLIKATGINAVRTSHYPNNSYFYELCDEYGVYVIDEMNLESHGLWDQVILGMRDVAQAVPGDLPEWRAALLDRATSMYKRDRNHPSVVMWSCGNESFGGTNILAVSDYFREQDDRPVHYEGVHWDPRYPQTTDVVSRMYAPAAEVEEWLTTHRDKPFIQCEYAHAMGNSFGAVDKYVDLAYREPLYQGGFIWDFSDQAILLKDRYGRAFFGYGGDCGEAPSDYEFSGNGILFADHSPTPKLAEVKYLYQGFRIGISAEGIDIENRFLFTDSSAFECAVWLSREGRVLREVLVNTEVAPGATGTVPLPFALPQAAGEYTVDVAFRLRSATRWAPAGHEVASEQAVFRIPGQPARTVVARPAAPELILGTHNVGVRGPHFTALFSRLYGGLASYRYGMSPDGGQELLRSIPRPNFWHAPTSNERGWKMPFRDGQWLLASRYADPERAPSKPEVVSHEDSVEVTYRYLLPTEPNGECDVAYRVFSTGRIEVTMTVRPGAGLPDMPEFGLLLEVNADLRHVEWYGEGPHECYRDRRGAARLGVHRSEVDRQLTPYLRPQEAGSHTGVRWAKVTDARGSGLRLDCASGMEFSALPWTPFEIENAAHHFELPPSHHTVLRPALMRRGVGGDDSWGAQTHPEYQLPRSRELSFRFGFEGLR